jgi:esterase/lipase
VDPEADGRVWCYNSIPGRAAHQVRQFNLRVRRLLPSVTAPTLVVMSTRDRTLDFASGPHVIQTIRSTDKELVTLHRSGHNILADAEREAVLDHTVRFFDRLCRP